MQVKEHGAGVLVPPREITQDELSFYYENGWVKLDGFITPETTTGILELLQGFGPERTREARALAKGGPTREEARAAAWTDYEDPSEDFDELSAFVKSKEMARAHARLLAVKSVRFWRDKAFVKMPAAVKGARTPWHQDFPYLPMDRTERSNIWIALVDVPPERGSLKYLSKSHQAGLLGRVLSDPDNDMLVQYPELTERYEAAPPLDMKAGDALAHHPLMVHAAPPNDTDEARWAYLSMYIGSNVLYTGAPEPLADQYDLTINEPFDNPRFPVIDID